MRDRETDAARPTGRFPRQERLRKRPEFRRIQERGQRVKTPHFIVLIDAQSEPDGLPRLGITASRKVGNAVARNRVKRVVRSAFRATRTLWARGIDVVIIVRRFDPKLDTLSAVAELNRARGSIQRKTRVALTPSLAPC